MRSRRRDPPPAAVFPGRPRHAAALREGGFTLPEQRGRHAFTLPELRGRHAFTLIELLVVIGIISVLLVAVIPVVNSLSKSSGRKGATSNLLGAIEQARAQAIKDGRATYIVFPTFSSGTAQSIMERYNYKSYAIFEDDPAGSAPTQLTNWKTLPQGVSLRIAISSSPWTPISFNFSPIGVTQSFPCIKFNASGEVESPTPASGPIQLSIFEGYVDGSGSEVQTSKPIITETINISRLTGRAERL